MHSLDAWVKRASSSAPAASDSDSTDGKADIKRPRGLRAPDDYRTVELIEKVHKKQVLWNRSARGFYSPPARNEAHKQVARALNHRFPGLRVWCKEEVESNWRLLVQYEFACSREHGPSSEKPHSFSCRGVHMSFMRAQLAGCTDYQTVIPRIYFRGSIYFQD